MEGFFGFLFVRVFLVTTLKFCTICEVHSSKNRSQVSLVRFQDCIHFSSNTDSLVPLCFSMGFLGGSDGKESACNGGNLSLIPRSGRSPG